MADAPDHFSTYIHTHSRDIENDSTTFFLQAGSRTSADAALPADARQQQLVARGPSTVASGIAGLPPSTGPVGTSATLLAVFPVQVPHRQKMSTPVLMEMPQHRPDPAGGRPNRHVGVFRR